MIIATKQFLSYWGILKEPAKSVCLISTKNFLLLLLSLSSSSCYWGNLWCSFRSGAELFPVLPLHTKHVRGIGKELMIIGEEQRFTLSHPIPGHHSLHSQANCIKLPIMKRGTSQDVVMWDVFGKGPLHISQNSLLNSSLTLSSICISYALRYRMVMSSWKLNVILPTTVSHIILLKHTCTYIIFLEQNLSRLRTSAPVSILQLLWWNQLIFQPYYHCWILWNSFQYLRKQQPRAPLGKGGSVESDSCKSFTKFLKDEHIVIMILC